MSGPLVRTIFFWFFFVLISFGIISVLWDGYQQEKYAEREAEREARRAKKEQAKTETKG